jgi:hypothetical protein
MVRTMKRIALVGVTILALSIAAALGPTPVYLYMFDVTDGV